MISRIGICVIAVVLIVLPLSCAKIEERKPLVERQMTTEKLPDMKTIPSKWGRLISVITVDSNPRWVQLWFQDEDGNVRMLLYYFKEHVLSPEARLIPRK
jgi:hypothetical protein